MAEQLLDNTGVSNAADQTVAPQDSGSNIMDLNSLYSPSPSISNDITLETHPALSQFNLTPDSGLGNNIKVTNQYNDTPKLSYLDQLKWDGEHPYADLNKYVNPYKAAAPYKFDAEKTNLDRYMAYGQSTFNRIGFNPTANNEERFNQETNIFNDLARAAVPFTNLVVSGAMNSARSWSDVVNGDIFNTDDKSASEFKKAMDIGMSSRGGVGGFLSNLGLNFAYTIGTIGEIFAEEAAIAAGSVLLSGETAGLSLLEGASLMARRGIQGAQQAMKFKQIGDMYKGGKSFLQSLRNINEAEKLYSEARAGAAEFTRAAGEFINPFTRTTEFASNLKKGEAGLTNMAKISSGFGSFYRDIRDINFSLAEGKLEGGSAKQETIDNLSQEYFEKNGSYPAGDDLKKILDTADKVGYATTLANLPTIYYSNKITLDGMFNFKGIGGVIADAENAASGIITNRAAGFTEDAFSAAEKSATKRMFSNLTSPKYYLGTGLGYFKRNFAEGIQESLQDVISNTAKDYYTSIYNDKSMGGLNLMMSSLGNGFSGQFSAQGAETFLSGFLMGGLMSKSQNLLFKTLPNLYQSTFNKEQYKEYQETRKQSIEDTVTSLNALRKAALDPTNQTMFSDPAKFFDPKLESLVNQINAGSAVNAAIQQNDDNNYHNAKDFQLFDHIHTVLRTGTYDMFMESLSDLKQLSSKDLAQAMNVQDENKAVEKLTDVINSANTIQKKYNLIQSTYVNPFKPKNFKKGTPDYNKEAIAFRSFENAKRDLLLATHSFDRSLDRMVGILDDLSQNKPLSKSSATDISVLFEARKIDDEISMLTKEIKTLDGKDPESKKLKKQKEDKLSYLKKYQEKLENHQAAHATHLYEMSKPGTQQTLFGSDDSKLVKAAEELKEAYKEYLKHIAEQSGDFVFDNKVDESFKKILDYYTLYADSKNLANIVNTLMNPTNLVRHAQGINEVLTEIFDKKDEFTMNNVVAMMRSMELNQIVNQLAALNIVIDEQDLVNYVKEGTIPKDFYSSLTQKKIPYTSDLYNQAIAIFNLDTKIANDEDITDDDINPITAQQTTAEPTQTTPTQPEGAVGEEGIQEEPTPTETTPTMDPALEKELRAAYDQYVADPNVDEPLAFEDFIIGNPRAIRIKTSFEKKNKPEEPPTGGAAPVAEPTTTVETKPVETSDIETKKADIEKDVNGEFIPKKYTLNARGENPAPNISISAIDLQDSGLQDLTDVKQIKLLEIRGKNSEGKTVGKVWIQKKDGQSFDAEVKFNDAKLAVLNAKPAETVPTQSKEDEIKALKLERMSLMSDESGASTERLAAINTRLEELGEPALQVSEVRTAKELVGVDKAKEAISKYEIRDLRDVDSILDSMITNDEITGLDADKILNEWKENAIKNFNKNSVKPGDIVIFVGGGTGIVVRVNQKSVTIKTDKDQPAKPMEFKDLQNSVKDIKHGKEKIEAVEAEVVTPEQTTTLNESRDVLKDVLKNKEKMAQIVEEGKKLSETDALNNILDNLGCDI
jgi:hypothetical protein